MTLSYTKQRELTLWFPTTTTTTATATAAVSEGRKNNEKRRPTGHRSGRFS